MDKDDIYVIYNLKKKMKTKTNMDTGNRLKGVGGKTKKR